MLSVKSKIITSFLFSYTALCFICNDPACHENSYCNTEVNQCECTNTTNLLPDPYCGSDGINYKNLNELKQTACKENRTIHPVKRGICFGCNNRRCHPASECDTNLNICVCMRETNLYSPVCGSDNVTYRNQHQLDAKACFEERNVTLSYKGFCLGPGICGHHSCHQYSVCNPFTNECVCEEIVNAIYAPVCGSDLHTYENKFILEAHSCHENISLNVLYDSRCVVNPPHCGDPKCHSFSYCDFKSIRCLCPSYNATVPSIVCGTDKKEYLNKLTLKEVACETNTNVSVAKTGKCSQESGKAEDEKNNLVLIIVPTACTLLVIALVLTVVCVWYRRKNRRAIKEHENTKNELPLL